MNRKLSSKFRIDFPVLLNLLAIARVTNNKTRVYMNVQVTKTVKYKYIYLYFIIVYCFENISHFVLNATAL